MRILRLAGFAGPAWIVHEISGTRSPGRTRRIHSGRAGFTDSRPLAFMNNPSLDFCIPLLACAARPNPQEKKGLVNGFGGGGFPLS